MASQIIGLDAFRRKAASRCAQPAIGSIPQKRRKNAATCQNVKPFRGAVVQIPTEANEQQRCEAMADRHRADCHSAILTAHARITSEPITGAIVVTSTDLKGGDFHLRCVGLYEDDPVAGLATLECLVEHFGELARDARNALARVGARPLKAPAFEVAL